MPKADVSLNLTLRVLGYEDDDDGWAAHCLETDLVGYGETFKAALKELMELTEMQVSYAIQTNRPSLLDHPAPPEIWQTYERLTQERLRNLQRPPQNRTTAIGSLPLSSKQQVGGRMAWCGA